MLLITVSTDNLIFTAIIKKYKFEPYSLTQLTLGCLNWDLYMQHSRGIWTSAAISRPEKELLLKIKDTIFTRFIILASLTNSYGTFGQIK